MERYRFEEGLTPLAGDLPEKWEGLLLLVTPAELAELRLPEGVTPPEAEWGAMLSGMREVVRTYPMGVLVPGITITLVVMSFSLVGDGLRDALDPKLKNN